jgi:hypothetical protein
MSHHVIIVGPNLPSSLQAKGTFHVHVFGCADLNRGPIRHHARDGWDLAVTSKAEVVLDCYGPNAGDFDLDPASESDRAFYRNDFYFAPCCSDIPEGTDADWLAHGRGWHEDEPETEPVTTHVVHVTVKLDAKKSEAAGQALEYIEAALTSFYGGNQNGWHPVQTESKNGQHAVLRSISLEGAHL